MRTLYLLALLLAGAGAAPTGAFDDNDTANTTLLVDDILEKADGVNTPTAPLFAHDCTDPHNAHVTCTVHEAQCDNVHAVPQVAAELVPPEVHDLRVDSYTKRRTAGNEHHLHVDISWQMPKLNSSVLLKAFMLEIVNEKANVPKVCYLMRVSENEGDPWVPRFRFSTTSLFDFSSNYVVRVRSLPRSINHSPVTQKRVSMMQDPGRQSSNETCDGPASKEAAKWTSSFHRIFLNQMFKQIELQFFAAPAHFCFEQYEVRLLDSGGTELMHAHIVDASEIKEVVQGNLTFYIGEHNFTDVEYDVEYIPSVIPVETSSTGRCLCPIEDGIDPHGVCSCIAADWKRMKLTALPAPTAAATTPGAPVVTDDDQSSSSFLYLVFGLLLLILSAILVVVLCRLADKFRSRGKLVRTRFVPDTQTEYLIDPRHPPLACNSNWSVLIVYSHDSAAHEASVLALAEFLRDSFNIKVHVDKWEQDEIEANLHDYINNAVLRVDKVLIVNSVGAYCRLQARSRGEPLERILNPSPLDRLFEAQIDMALQHARVISMRFSFTPATATLFSLSPLLQYSVPENLPLLLSALTENSARNDPRLMVGGAGGYDPCLDRLRACVTRMQNAIDADPEWFEKSHRRVPMRVTAIGTPPLVATPTRRVASTLDSGYAESSFIEQAAASVEPEAVEPAIAAATTAAEEPAPDSGVVCAAVSESTVVEVPLEEEEEEEQRASTSAAVPAKAAADDVGSGDSAYHSGSHLHDEEDLQDGIEMSRLDAGRRRGTEVSDDSGRDETSSEGERTDELAGLLPPQQRIEHVRRVKAKGEEMDTGDSGMLSDYNSGLIENY